MSEKDKSTKLKTTGDEPSSLSGFGVISASGGIMRTSLDPKFVVDKHHADVLDVMQELSAETPQNIMLTGPQGCGKTELCIWFGAKYDRPVLIVNCATMREPRDWFGYRDARDGSLFWHKSDFVRAVEMGGCVIVLDEFNRLHTSLHNTLYPLLDARRMTWLEELESNIRVGAGTVFMATANVGFQHTGTFTLDSALEDRFGCIVHVDFPPPAVEEKIVQEKTGITAAKAKKLVRLADQIRRKTRGTGATLSRAVSTRQLLQTATMMKRFSSRGIPESRAFEHTIVPCFPSDGGVESEQAQVLQMVQGHFV